MDNVEDVAACECGLLASRRRRTLYVSQPAYISYIIFVVCLYIHTCVNSEIYFRKVNSSMDLVYYHAHKHMHGMARKAHRRPSSFRCTLLVSSSNEIFREIVESIPNNIFFSLLLALCCWLTADCCCCVGSSILLIRYEFGLLQPKGSYSSHILMSAAAYIVRWSCRQTSLKFLPSSVRRTNEMDT